MKFRTCVSIVILTAWTLIRVLSPAGADIVSCNCADACGCPDDDTSDNDQPTWCNGTTEMTCTCSGSSCPTGTGETCVAQTVCAGAAGSYEPCGGKGQDACECGGSECQNAPGETCETKDRCNAAAAPYKPCGGTGTDNCTCVGLHCPKTAEEPCEDKQRCDSASDPYKPCAGEGDCPCGGEYCADKDGPAGGTAPSCNKHCNSAKETACGAAKDSNGSWNQNGRKQCSQSGCQTPGCGCPRYYCKNSTAGKPDVKDYPCACWDCSFATCECGSPGDCDRPNCKCECSSYDGCPCEAEEECGREQCKSSL